MSTTIGHLLYCVSTENDIHMKQKNAGRSGLAVARLTAMRDVMGLNRTVGSCAYRKKPL